MAKELNQTIAAKLYDLMTLTVVNTRVSPRQHRGNVLFVGYADFQIELDGIPFLTLCGNSIKLMGDQIHFDPKSEKGKGERGDHYFPHWFPAGAEARAVLTEQLKRDETIIQMCHEAVNRVTGQQAQA